MKKLLLLTTTLLGLVVQEKLNAQNDNNQASEAINKFTFDMYKQVSKEGENLFFSPYSISSALAMTYAGAESVSKDEMQKTLYFDADKNATHQGFRLLNQTLAQHEKVVQINIANSLWIQKNFKFKDDYFKAVKYNYNAQLEYCDFKSEPEAARVRINKWVETKTKEKIKDLIPSGGINDMTRLVLTNAIYFKAEWNDQFTKEASAENNFYLNADKSNAIKATFMNKKFRINYYEDNYIQAIEIPYKNRGFSMLIILPSQSIKISEVEKQLDYANYSERISKLAYTNVQVSLPKFTIESSFDLSEQLINLGMPKSFSRDADFSGMTGEPNLMIDKVFHKTFIQVDEEGTEAAAATAVVMMEKSAAPSREIKVFNANRPFIFMIKEFNTGAIIFAGKVEKP